MENQEQEFTERLIKFLAERSGSGIMIIVNGPNGFEMLSSSADVVFQLGMARAAVKTLDYHFAIMTKAAIDSGEMQRRSQETEMILNNKPKGGVN